MIIIANKLKNMRLTSVDLTRAGANQEADICLFKSDDPQDAAELPTEGESNILKRFLAWLKDNPVDLETRAHSAPHEETPVEKADEQPDLTSIYKSAITESIKSILADNNLDLDAKIDMVEKSIAQYHEKMLEVTNDYAPELVSDADELEVEKSDDLDTFDMIEEVTVNKSAAAVDGIETLEEVEKFNPYHDEKGRFATSSSHASFTVRTKDPKKQHMADMAIAREKERAASRIAEKPKVEKPKVEFTPAKTKKEAVQYAKDKLGFKNVSYGTKLDIDTINHVNEEITKIQAKYPEVKGAVETLKTTTSKAAYAQIRTFADGTMNFEIGSNQYGKGLEGVKASYARDVERGFHPKDTDHSSIIHHEYGHVLATISSKKKVGVAANAGISDLDTKREFISNRRGCKTESEWRTKAAQSLGVSRGDIATGISRYATKNPAETFAEAFAEVSCSPNPRAEAVAMVKASGWYR